MSRRRGREADSDSDEEPSRLSLNLTPLSQASNGSKRIRLSSREDEKDDEVTLNGEGNAQRTSISAAQTSQSNGLNGRQLNGDNSNKHGAGAIVRVKLTDFVTYNSAEFFPGPKLNMVIGPNGTGKSTLVCAICLGLGWGPQHLGRAKDVGEFVKNGCREATIEIELAGGNLHRRNPVIRRIIKHEGNKSTFTINGNPSTKNEVLTLARKFSIQIDNLCQFLPQDKVSEFAALSPVELLHSTQRAAAGPEMIEWHENLKSLRAGQKRLQLANGGDKETLTNLESRQEMQRADVERMKQRAEVKKRIQLLEKVRPIPQYREAHKEALEAREKKVKLQKELDDLKNKTEPAVRATNAKKDYLSQIEDVVRYRRRLVHEADSKAQNTAHEMESTDRAVQDLNNQIDAERRSGRKQLDTIKQLQQRINRLKRQAEEEPVEFDGAFYTEQIREKVRAQRELETKATELQENKKEFAREYRDKTNRLKDAEERLTNLDSQAGQQEALLERISPDTAKAWNWIKKNQDHFEHQVFGPPIVECSVKDPRYANALESLLQRNDFLCFTTQSSNDFKKLQQKLSKEMRLHDITLKTCSHALNSYPPRISDEQMRSLGFDGWARDYLAGPDPVLALLCSENNIHQTPLVLRDISDEDFKRMENGPVSSWVAGKQGYQVVRRREYGPGATSTRVRQVRPARYWTNRPVDTSAKDGIQEKIRDWKEDLQQMQERFESDKAKIGQISDQRNDIIREKAQLEKEKSEKQTALTNFRLIPEKLKKEEDKLQPTQEAFRGVSERVQELRIEQDRLTLTKAARAIEYADNVENIRQLYEDMVLAEIRRIEAASDYNTLRERNAEIRESLAARQNEVAQATADLRQKTERSSKVIHPLAKAVANEARRDQDLFAVIEEMKERTPHELEAEIDSENARLAFTYEGNANVIEEFEQRQGKIDKLREKLAGFEKELSDLDASIAEIREKWEPRLEALVQKISDAFSDSFARIGCAGQVSVDKAEHLIPGGRAMRNADDGDDAPTATPHTDNSSDFDQWSIKIQVKFREHEALSVLDSHRQSGGERAVSTIFYLMALQSLSASPFRVVDEINQGMDPRNERMVHEHMVNIACNPNEKAGGQYFLITPKLLNGLVYRRGMKVLCIASGEYMPEDYEKLDFKKCVERMKKVHKERNKGGGIEVNGESSRHRRPSGESGFGINVGA